MVININFCGVEVDVEFKEKWNMLSGYSGTGKTFLLQAIELFCMNNNIIHKFIDCRFKDSSVEQIMRLCEDASVILLDNADLYLDNKLLSWLKKENKTIIICMKNTSVIDMRDIHEYIVTYENKKISIEEI